MQNRDQCEWCNLWWEEASDSLKPRVLLIGDSITAGYRPYVNSLMNGKAYVDMLATSKAIDDNGFGKELAYVLGEYHYSIIHFNNGLHGFHVTNTDYELYLNKTVSMIHKTQSGAKLILATSTPVLKKDSVEALEENVNWIVTMRNQVVFSVADKTELPVNDLYAAMVGKNHLRMTDSYHFNEDGKKEQAKIVAKLIEHMLEE